MKVKPVSGGDEALDAFQWITNGDHPMDESVFVDDPVTGMPTKTPGKLVKPYAVEGVDPEAPCERCPKPMKYHGMIDEPAEEGKYLCQRYWVVTNLDGTHTSLSDEDFKAQYKAVFRPIR